LTGNTNDESEQITAELQSHLGDLAAQLAERLDIERNTLMGRLDSELFQSRCVQTRVEYALRNPNRPEKESPVMFPVASGDKQINVAFNIEPAADYPEIRLAFEPYSREPPIRMSFSLAANREPPIIW
jgi:hypothetical protein